MSVSFTNDNRKLPWDALPDPTFHYQYELFEKILLNEFVLSIDKTRRKVLDYITILRGNTNLYLADADSLGLAWDELTDHDDLQDFILKVCMTLRFYVGTEGWKALIQNIAGSLGLFGRLPALNIMIADAVFTDSVLTVDKANSILLAAPWVVIMFFLTLIDSAVIAKLGSIIGRVEEQESSDATQNRRSKHAGHTENPS